MSSIAIPRGQSQKYTSRKLIFESTKLDRLLTLLRKALPRLLVENRHVHIKRYVEEVESFPLSISLVGAGTGFERWKMQTFPLCP